MYHSKIACRKGLWLLVSVMGSCQCYLHLINLLYRSVSPLPSPVRWCSSTSLFSRSGRPGAISCIQTRWRSWSESRTTDTGITRKYRKTSRIGSLGSRARQGGKNASVGRARGRKLLTNQSLKHLEMVNFLIALLIVRRFLGLTSTSSLAFSLQSELHSSFFCLILSIAVDFVIQEFFFEVEQSKVTVKLGRCTPNFRGYNPLRCRSEITFDEFKGCLKW